MKPEKTNLVRIEYNKEKNKYFATFKIWGLDENEIGKIISYVERLETPENRKIYIKDCNVYVTDLFEAEAFESTYPNIINAAREGLIPERVEPSVLNVEVDLCMMEDEVDFSVRRVLI
ncbi:hypothetical protein [Methanobacterium sp.]|jgi:hypothetical protein|uniref:hypothetical protein n=1 Tax=Methanobacterium sp. TaxID=2164 RepID=UPI0031580432